MLVSAEARFVLVSVPKSGSSSLEAALGPHTRIHLRGHPSIKHATLAEFNQYLRPFLELKGVTGVESVASIREPIDWLMSWWRYRRRGDLAGSPKHTGDVTFDEFAEGFLAAEPPPYAALRIKEQSEFVVDGDALADHLYRYEHLDALVRWLEERLGAELTLPARKVSDAPRVDVEPGLAARLRAHFARDYEIWEQARTD